MCWNKEVSLNTFLFSSFVLGLIMYNNAYTPYKIVVLNNVYAYIFFMSFILMQLIEYFIWINIKNPLYNSIFTGFATLLLIFQPIASNMLITNEIIRKKLLYSYLLFIIPLSIYRFNIKNMNSSVSKLGHLQWNTLSVNNNPYNILFTLIWFFFFLFPLFYQKYNFGLAFGLLTLIIITYNFFNDDSVGSMWCWIVNIIMIYYAVYLLLYLPFFK
jgi:hypothetical protein